MENKRGFSSCQKKKKKKETNAPHRTAQSQPRHGPRKAKHAAAQLHCMREILRDLRVICYETSHPAQRIAGCI
jgi:hypothetical protein